MNKVIFIKNSMLHRLGLLILLGLLLSACGSNIGASPTAIPLPAIGENATPSIATPDGTEPSDAESDSENSTAEASTGETSTASTESNNDAESATSTDSNNGDDSTTGDSTEVASGSPALVPTATPEAEAVAESTSAKAVTGEGSSPIQLDIERIRLSVPITPMEWRIVKIDDQRTTEWIIPDDSAGWHPDSAMAGAAGNVIISGYQNAGGAVFSQLALGNVQVGMEISLIATDGSTHTYIVSEVGTPIPLDGTSAAEEERAADYYAPSDDARLTLVTGWPAFTTTHRLFVVATLMK